MPALATNDVDRPTFGGFGNRGTDSGLVGDIGNAGEMRGARGYGPIQSCPVAAENRDGRARPRECGGDREPDAPPASGDQRMRGTRQSGHAPSLPECFRPKP
jgi:hypothetical protein